MLNDSQLELKLWIESFRYSLSRRSYATGEFCDYFKKYFAQIPEQAQAIIKRELQETSDQQAASQAGRGGWVGDACDIAEWEDLLDWINQKKKVTS